MEFPLAQFLTTSSVFYTLQVIAYIKKKKSRFPVIILHGAKFSDTYLVLQMF